MFERPTLISRGQTIYLDSLKDVAGKVLVECVIDTFGQINSAQIFKTHDERLNMLALETIRSYEFKPGKQNEKKSSGKW